MFRKDVYLGEHAWLDVLQWEGDVRDVDNRMPTELAVTKAMSDDELKYSIQMRIDPDPSHVDHENLCYKMYLVFAAYGDLDSLIKRHMAPLGMYGPRPMPEPFIWCVAEAMGRAAVAMRRGEHFEEKGEEWKEIVHRYDLSSFASCGSRAELGAGT